ncbi:NmrA-like family protein [Aspergillus steynii IBT 23096]|uniref:NmrA-like family protein n=1 Tax=Aspergillus steynii IBT 23096 TaxID=1392250 RepID=A0A2I2FSL0_9EURO|nr:NmrA-like family protein [Aspergillus steynii IBT 23096]PLB43607.1 NmrA-like family protein [Aspergillus steynii IBT 23096]
MPPDPTSARRIITVFGTGKQAGAVARSLLADRISNFHVRAVSRHPDSAAARSLAALGAEIVHADGWDRDALTRAFAGSWAAFVNTNSDDPSFLQPDGPTELDLGRTIIDCLGAAGVQHLVYSCFASSLEQTQGKLFIKPMEMKYRALRYAHATNHFTTICGIYAAWYFEQFLDRSTADVFGGFPLVQDSDGYFTFRPPVWGDVELPSFVSVTHDFGDIVHGVLLQPEEWNGKSIPATSDVLSFEDVTAAFEDATGQKARYIPLGSWEDFGQGIPELDDHRLLFAFTQATGGRYFGDVPTETDTALKLKRLAVEAQGKEGGQARLLRLEEWFRACLPARESRAGIR